LTARARIGRKSTSAACAALKSASTITLRGAYLLRYAQESSWREDRGTESRCVAEKPVRCPNSCEARFRVSMRRYDHERDHPR
jgi:hypothetical protein